MVCIMIEASLMERRTSLRLKSIRPDSKKPNYAPIECHKKIKISASHPPKPRKNKSVPNVSMSVNKRIAAPEISDCNGTAQQQVEKNADDTAQLSIGDKGDLARVKDTLKVYTSHFLRLNQEHQMATSQGTVRGVKHKKTKTGKVIVTRCVNRFDLQAISEMKKANEILYCQKRIGNLRGIDVGFRFYSRCEMCAVGFHNHWLNGIDYIGKASKEAEYKGYKFPLAVSIVISGQYEDDVDNAEDVWYTGQGGNDLLASKSQVKDQELSRGNLALKNNMAQLAPVRVIRGNKSGDKECHKIYIYDGLYKVVECLSEKGASGFIIYKFRLKREPGQPKLTSEQVRFAREHKPYSSRMFPGLVSLDIASGQEGISVRVINTVDSTARAPTGFTYTNSIQVSEGIELPVNAEGCKCKGSCTDENSCACAILNGNEFPYVRLNGGRLIRAKDVVYECGPNCGCGPGCINRISQRKLKYKLEIFQTQEKGWAVRSGDFIHAGAPVCEYIGVLKKTGEMDNVSVNDYIFEIDCQHTMNGIGGRQRRSTDASALTSAQADNIDDKASDPDYCIDAASVGNVARFINHSCQPNLFVQCVLSSHHDPKFARIVLVASENISPFEELTYDYGYALDSVVTPGGEVKRLSCYCGAADCRKRLY